MRTRAPHSRAKQTFNKREYALGALPLHVHIITSKGRIDDVALELSDQFRCTLTIFDSPDIEKPILDWLTAYASHSAPPFPLTLLNLDNQTPFSLSALTAMAAIPSGKSISYSDLAHSINRPKAHRAIGSVCHHNPFPLLIPCHRILAKHSIGGFAYPIALKKLLLSFESNEPIKP